MLSAILLGALIILDTTNAFILWVFVKQRGASFSYSTIWFLLRKLPFNLAKVSLCCFLRMILKLWHLTLFWRHSFCYSCSNKGSKTLYTHQYRSPGEQWHRRQESPGALGQIPRRNEWSWSQVISSSEMVIWEETAARA